MALPSRSEQLLLFGHRIFKMSILSGERSDKDFVRRSQTESVCIHCGETLRASNASCLRVAEEVHPLYCPTPPRSLEPELV